MRDPRRIPIFMKKMQELWELCPDLRFFQIITLIQESKSEISSNLDHFYLEDDLLRFKIEQIIREIQQSDMKIKDFDHHLTPIERIVLSGY